MKGKIAIVTGGGRGIGRAISYEMGERGVNVAIIYDRDADSAREVADNLNNMGVTAQAYQCDIASYEDVKKVIEKILCDFGDVDFLINNAGKVKDRLLLKMTEQEYDDVINTNLKGVFNTIKHLYSHFIKKRAGKIVNVASISGLDGNIGQANYASAKAGIIGLTKTVAKELGSRNVNCNAVAPGFTETQMTENLNDSIKEKAVSAILLKRFAAPSEIAKVVAFLCSEDSSYITGQVIRVDGGLVL